MNFRASAGFEKDGSIVLVGKEELGQKKFFFQHSRLKENLTQLHKSGRFVADQNEMFPVSLKGKIILFVGLGKRSELSETVLRMTVRKALLSSFLAKIRDIEIIPHEDSDDAVAAIIEAALIGTYRWKKYLTKEKDSKAVDQKNIWIAASHKKIFDQIIETCAGVNFSRDLINDNADTVTSEFIEKTVRGVVKGQKNVSLEILNQKELKSHGLNLHLAVNRGSRNEPKLIIVKYSGGAKKEKYTAIIGKGITFDTGGLNLKPTGSIETMRTDMSGAAAVIGVLKNTIALGLKKNIIFAVGVAENVIGSGSYKPGDVIQSYSGKTVEVGNTDAEGRLVLADVIAYIVKNYKPQAVIDIATLTGACVVALGHDYSGLFSNDDEFARKILQSAKKTDDRAWQLPVYPELKEHIKSLVADIKNVGLPRGAGGACSAAEFLRQFVGDTTWAHLDIAGTAFVQESARLYFGHGATGVGVRLLTNYLQNN